MIRKVNFSLVFTLKNDNFTIENGKFSRVFLETPLKYQHSGYGVYCVSSLYINYLWLIQLKWCVCGYANLPLHCYPNIFVTLTRLNCPVTHIIKNTGQYGRNRGRSKPKSWGG